MAAKIKYYRCQNRNKCDLAKKRQTIEISTGARFVCPSSEPNCERTFLREIDGPPPALSKLVVLGIAAALAVAIGIITLIFWPVGDKSDASVTVETALREVWPWLE